MTDPNRAYYSTYFFTMISAVFGSMPNVPFPICNFKGLKAKKELHCHRGTTV
jgi:hypothetical protein